MYQTCTEFGFFQTSDSDKQPFGNLFPLKYVEINTLYIYKLFPAFLWVFGTFCWLFIKHGQKLNWELAREKWRKYMYNGTNDPAKKLEQHGHFLKPFSKELR